MSNPFPFTRREIMQDIAARSGGRCLLAFSRGKDSIAAWLELRESGLFREIVPFHLEGVPGLTFIEESLKGFEQTFRTRIIRLPHPSFYRQLGGLVFQPPERVDLIRRLGMPELTGITYNDIRRWLAEDLGWNPDSTWTATGLRATDSPRRRIHVVKCRGRNATQRQFYPIFDYRKADVLTRLKEAGISLPADYELFGRSFDGIDHRFAGPLKRRRPADYERLRFWFPLVELEILRYQEREGKNA